jgi:hypothetical protein
MPFDLSSPLRPVRTLGVSDYDRPDPAFLETVGAAFRQENLIGSALTSRSLSISDEDYFKVEPDYDVYNDIKGYESYADKFEQVYNRNAAQAVKADIDQEKKDRDILSASGWTGYALSVGASILDPTIFLPGGALFRSGRVGYDIGKTAFAVSGAAGGAAAIQEAGLHATQHLRTPEESFMAVGGSALLGGIVGAAGAKFLSRGEWDTFGKTLKSELESEVPNPDEIVNTLISRAQSVGASSVDNIKIDDLGVGSHKIAQAIAKATDAVRINPGVQTMFSPSVKVREAYQKMVDNPIYTKMNMDGGTLGPAVENLVKQYQRGSLSEWIRSGKKLYKEARKDGFQGSRSDFYDAVARAGRRGDVDEGGNAFVTKAAEEARDKIFDPLLKRAQEAKLLLDDVTPQTARTYVTRLWNRERLIAREPEFRGIAGDYFRREIANVPKNKLPDFANKADMDDYVEEIVTGVFNNLTGRGKGDVPEWIVPIKRGPLKDRTFKIADSEIEQFLQNDMEMILRKYSRTMAAEVELTEKFGSADMKDTIDGIRKDYEVLRKEAQSEAKRMQLDKAERRDIENIEAFRDMLRGTYRSGEEGSGWSKITRAASTWNYMRLLGGVTISSLTDASRVIGVHGLRATFREALPALVSGLRGAKISRGDARRLGVVAESVLQSRLASLADLNDPYAYGSKFERYLSNASHAFTRATGLSWWNDTMKTVASVMTQNRILKNSLVGDYSKLNKYERAYMGFLGIDETMSQRIAQQFEKHGAKEGGILGANVYEWDDILAQRTYAAALAKDVDRTIVTKGIADTPLWMKTNWGRLIMQFKSFGLASHQRVLIAGLQERPHRFLEQMAMATSIGMMVAYLKFVERGEFDEAERLLNNPGLWIADGLDRTGILSLPFEVSNTAEKLGLPFGITTAAQKIAGDEDQGGTVSRYATRNKLGAVMGPAAGLFEDLSMIAEQMSKGDLKKSGANAIIRQIPGATLPGIKSAIHVGIKPAVHDAVE